MVMKEVIKYAKFFLFGFFFLGFSAVSAKNFTETERLSIKTKHDTLKPLLILTDSTSSKKKRRKLEKATASKAKSYEGQNVYYTNLRKDLSKYERNEKGNTVSTNSYAINDRSESNAISNVVSLNIYDKKLNTHSFSGTQSSMFSLNFTSENNVNTKRDLFGFEYRFKRAETKKFGYAARARLERDDRSQTYYQLGIRASLKGNKRFNLLGLEHFPVRSGPGHVLELYRTQLTNYNEFQLTKKLKQIASFEGNYYSDVHADFIFSSRTEFLLVESGLLSILPLMEAAYGLGSINRRDGYPYWMADKRAYGGGGLALGIGSEKSAFKMIADAAIFGEIGQANFERYTGNLSYRIKDFTTINAGFEVYTIESFYSNVFQLGMVYNFK